MRGRLEGCDYWQGDRRPTHLRVIRSLTCRCRAKAFERAGPGSAPKGQPAGSGPKLRTMQVPTGFDWVRCPGSFVRDLAPFARLQDFFLLDDTGAALVIRCTHVVDCAPFHTAIAGGVDAWCIFSLKYRGESPHSQRKEGLMCSYASVSCMPYAPACEELRLTRSKVCTASRRARSSTWILALQALTRRPKCIMPILPYAAMPRWLWC